MQLKRSLARRPPVGIVDPDVAERTPFQLAACASAWRRRCAGARPGAADADEPSTALDVTTPGRNHPLLKRAAGPRHEPNLITHDLRRLRPAIAFTFPYAGFVVKPAIRARGRSRSLSSLFWAVIRAASRSAAVH